MKRSKRKKAAHPQSRLEILRQHLALSKIEMAERLGLKPDTYYKNESGINSLSLTSLRKLQKNFEVSLDWYLFGKGPMLFDDKEPEVEPEPVREELELIDQMPELNEMLKQMKEDRTLRYEMLSYFYKLLGSRPTPENI